MIWDLVLFGLLLVFAGLGFLRGTLESGLRLVALVASYGAAVYVASTRADALAEALQISPLVAMPIAGTVAFFACHLFFAAMIIAARSAERRSREGEARSALDRLGGAGFGLVRGGAFAVLLGWLGLFVGALQEHEMGGAALLPAPEGSALVPLTGKVVESSAAAWLGDTEPGARMTTAMLARPTETLDTLQDVVAHPRFVALQQDQGFWAHVQAGDTARAFERRSFRAFSSDDSVRASLHDLGLISAASAGDPLALEEELRPVLDQVAERVAQLQHDAQLQGLLHDPAVQRMLQQGDTVGLLRHPGFQSLVRRITAS